MDDHTHSQCWIPGPQRTLLEQTVCMIWSWRVVFHTVFTKMTFRHFVLGMDNGTKQSAELIFKAPLWGTFPFMCLVVLLVQHPRWLVQELWGRRMQSCPMQMGCLSIKMKQVSPIPRDQWRCNPSNLDTWRSTWLTAQLTLWWMSPMFSSMTSQ